MNLLEYLLSEAKKKGLEVEFIDFSIGYRTNTKILLNKHIFLYPDFAKEVIDHELTHTGEPSMEDFKKDLLEGSILNNLKFCLRHPKAFMQFIPLIKYDSVWYLDRNLLINYGLITVGLLIIAALSWN
jgi:hypothetical protein